MKPSGEELENEVEGLPGRKAKEEAKPQGQKDKDTEGRLREARAKGKEKKSISRNFSQTRGPKLSRMTRSLRWMK